MVIPSAETPSAAISESANRAEAEIAFASDHGYHVRLNMSEPNTAVLIVNTTGFDNTGNGAFALKKNTTGRRNTANGGGALHGNTTGSDNIALGSSAGVNLTTGNNNIDIGNGGVAGEALAAGL
jgi:hypothetical protein